MARLGQPTRGRAMKRPANGFGWTRFAIVVAGILALIASGRELASARDRTDRAARANRGDRTEISFSNSDGDRSAAWVLVRGKSTAISSEDGALAPEIERV